jgi:tetratricopeptide (TPR) repeat protein
VIELLLQADRLLNVDMIDQAEAIYRRVAEQDPRNAIAVVGLARCALARGDDREGYRLMSQALTIDPEYDMARRLEARLAETLAARGESVERPPAAEGPVPGIDLALPGAGPPVKAPPRPTTTSTRMSARRRRSLLDRFLGR